MEKRYDHKQIESPLAESWQQRSFENFDSNQQKSARFSIILPPPNITGHLHMGHAFQLTLMDILIRFQNMNGSSTLWQGGFDHAGIAGQIAMEGELRRRGLLREKFSEHEFLTFVQKWQDETSSNIAGQMARLGSSLDWQDLRFTLDNEASLAVRKAFVELFQAGLIYEKDYLVNWDPVLKSAISDLEVINTPENGLLWFLKYFLSLNNGTTSFLEIATTRPETIFGDVAVAVHPDDDRYKELIGKSVRVPLTDRLIPIIADHEVERDFGSGCLKITPAHDFTDFKISNRHNLARLNILHQDGSFNEEVPERYQNLDRFKARELILEELSQKGFLLKKIPHSFNIPRNARSNVIIEPLLTRQWFLNCRDLAKQAIEVVKSEELEFVPENWGKIYISWLEEIEDWCISRQLWWGHQIPIWRDDTGEVFAGLSEEELRKEYDLPKDRNLVQEKDVLDTWFSSALWSFASLGWPKKTIKLKEFFPSQVLVTGFDIIFFWVARMVMLGLFFTKKVPFQRVLITGLIRDQDGQKMSKSRGNVLDPIDFIDGIDLESLIQKRTKSLINPSLADKIAEKTRRAFPNGIPSLGADALRFTFARNACQGRDIRIGIEKISASRRFLTKIWNAARFIEQRYSSMIFSYSLEEYIPDDSDLWIIDRIANGTILAEKNINQFRFDLYAQDIQELFWEDFCACYLECKKISLAAKIDTKSYQQELLFLIEIFSHLLGLLHPIIPFLTQEIWATVIRKCQIKEDPENLWNRPFHFNSYLRAYQKKDPDGEQSRSFHKILDIISKLRAFLKILNIRKTEGLILTIYGGSEKENQLFIRTKDYFKALLGLTNLEILNTGHDISNAIALPYQNLRLSLNISKYIKDLKAERRRLEKRRETLTQKLVDLKGRLGNSKFLEKAPPETVEKSSQIAESLEKEIHFLSEIIDGF